MNVLEKILEEISNIYRVVESDEDLEWNRGVDRCQNIIHSCMEDIPDITKQANDILEKLSFLYGQRAGRELWSSKPRKVQNEDIASFNRDVDYLWTIINGLNNKNDGWIPVEERLPEDNRYILLSFENFSLPLVGRYEENEEGGAFYIGDCDEEDTCIFNDLYVNAWMPLPKPYRSDPCHGCFGAANNDCQICDKGGKV